MNIIGEKIMFTFSYDVFIILIVALGGLAISQGKEINCLRKESQALLEFKGGLSDDEGILSSWKNGADCCQWEGVQCDNGKNRVAALHLSGLVSEGKMISPSLLKLDKLYHLDLSFIGFSTRQIPDFIGSLGKLQYLNLSYCYFGGMIPHSIQNLSMLQFLDLGASRNLHSDLGWLFGLQSLEFLDLSEVNLTEANTWAQAINKLSKVKEIRLSGCSLPSALSPSPLSPWALNISSSLSYIDLSSNDIANWRILDALKNFTHLSHLNLGSNNLQGSSIPDSLWNFTHLSYLDLSLNGLEGSISKALGNLVSLSYLDLSNNRLGGSIPSDMGNLMFLSYLDLSDNQLGGSIPRTLSNLTSVSHLDLSNNLLQLIEFPDQLSLSRLVILSLAKNKLQGNSTHLLMQLWNSTLLEQIDLSENALFGSLPSMSGFQRLKELRLHDNHLNASIGEESFRLPSLEILDLSKNELIGRIPNLSSCSSLRELSLNDNMLNSSLTESIGSLANLEQLNLGSNHLEGLISEAHLFNLSNLNTVDLSFNSNLTLRINSLWNPPFQLTTLLLANCKLGPHFPEWLREQTEITELDISNAAILDTIPNWFWNTSKQSDYLNMSHNQIYGTLPDLSSVFTRSMDLSFNQLSGILPSMRPDTNEMYLSNNRFVGSTMNVCKAVPSHILDLSHNQLSGHIPPDCFTNLASLYYLNLGDNNLSGKIQIKHSDCNLLSLHLRNNSFTGYIPKSLGRCRELIALDLQQNKFYGTIPGWLGESMPNLVILSFKANKLHGSIPPSLCRLQKLQVLDISMNSISDAIPKCVKNFTALTSEIESNLGSTGLVNLTRVNGKHFFDNSALLWKGQVAEYSNTLWLLKAIDFSNNNLSGEITSLVELVQLVGLNLSRNNFNGSIPRSIGQMKVLDFLDLSHNHLSGSIPPTLSQLSHLGMLELSFNNLSGKIPRGKHLDTFDAASYIGNAGLCGPPLVSKPCPEDVEMQKKPNLVDQTNKMGHEDMFKRREFYISMAFGFIISFWGVFGTLYLSKRWNLAILKMFTTVDDWLYVKIRMNKRRVQRYFHNEE